MGSGQAKRGQFQARTTQRVCPAGRQPCSFKVEAFSDGALTLYAAENNEHLSSSHKRGTRQVKSGSNRADYGVERMRVQGAFGGDIQPALQPQGSQYAAGPLGSALGIVGLRRLQTAAGSQAEQRFAVKQHEVARAMKAAPVVMAKNAAVECVHVGSFDQN